MKLLPGWRPGLGGLRSQLMALTAGSMLAALALLGLRMAGEQTALARQALADQATATARSIALGAEHPLLDNRLDVIEELMLHTAELPGVRGAWVVDPTGVPLVQVLRPEPGEPPQARYAKPGERLVAPATAAPRLDDAGATSMLLAWHPIVVGNLVGWVRVDFGTESLLTCALAMGCSLLLLQALLHRPMRAVRRAADFAADLERANGRTLPDQAGAREVRELVRALNQASTQLFSQRQAIESHLDRLRRQEAELADRNEQLALLFNLSPDGIVSLDDAGRIRYANPAVARMLACEVDTLHGRTETWLDDTLRERCRGDAWQPLAGLFDAEHLHLPRQRVARLASPWPMVLAMQGVCSHAASARRLLYVRDITRETEVDRMKSEFLSTAAHELRTPMTSIHGFVELLAHRDFPPEKRASMLARVYRNSSAMCRILEDLLDLARIEARRGADFEVARVDLADVVHEVMEVFVPPAGRDAPHIAGPLLSTMADAKKMTQVLGNLLSNAYKYSPGGGDVTVALCMQAGEVGLEVADHGIGMTPEQLARVFERFFRADASGAIPGTGLGMSIVKEIVDLHGGRIELASTPGEGTRVVVWLPAAPAPEARDAAVREAAEPWPA
jgi:two-component system, OmpR family, sensor histidine kinase VicK